MSASRGNPVHYRAQNYRRLMLGKCRETTEKWQRTVLKKLVKRRKHSLSLSRKSFKNRENIRRKQEAGNIRRERAFSGQNRRVGNSAENLVPFLMEILLKKCWLA